MRGPQIRPLKKPVERFTITLPLERARLIRLIAAQRRIGVCTLLQQIIEEELKKMISSDFD